MIKPVPIARALPGMWFHRLGGAGYHHAFVRKGFLIDAHDIELLAEGGVDELLIDTEKGVDYLPEGEAFSSENEPAASDPQVQEPQDVPAAQLSAPAIVLPRSGMDEEIHRARKLCDEGKEKVIALFNDARLGRAVHADTVMPLVEQINASVSRHPDALLSVARLKTHDEYTYLHSVAVCALMVSLARRLGLPDEQVREAGVAGMLHDLGKAAMPIGVLNKPGALSDDEFKIMKAHPIRGWEMLRDSGGASEAVLDVILHHHEKFDGSGYPHNLKGDAISLMARMGAVCDVYDAITSNRPYKKAWGPAESLQRMFGWRGHFDELILKSFIRSVGIYPVGALVRLESDRLAVILEQSESSLLEPRVRIFFNARKREPVIMKDLDLGSKDCGDRIVSIESNEKWNFPNLEKLWLAQ